jgi:hypothetical protein
MNRFSVPEDHGLSCEVSTRLLEDPRASELDRRRSRNHQRFCPECASLADIATELSASDILLRASEGNPAQKVTSTSKRGKTVRRSLLAVTATVQAFISIPWTFGANPLANLLGHPAAEHLTRDGTLGILLAVAGLVTVWRSRYAFAMLGVGATIVLLQLGAGAVDERSLAVGIHFELIHSLTLAVAALIAVTAWRRDSAPIT